MSVKRSSSCLEETDLLPANQQPKSDEQKGDVTQCKVVDVIESIKNSAREKAKVVKKSIGCTIVADSINLQGDRITTFKAILPRICLAEINTHRMISKNSASSRARPFLNVLIDVLLDPFIPIKFLAKHTGMQGTQECKDPEKSLKLWLEARDRAAECAVKLHDAEITKQLANRVLEPFLWHEVILTATDFQNFFALRAHKDAEIHLAKLAESMLLAYNSSTPTLLQEDEWHIPFGDQMDMYKVKVLSEETGLSENQIKVQIASARCARLSYVPFGEEASYDYSKDLALHNKLWENGHMSPFEHCARCLSVENYNSWKKANILYCGNIRGFMQYRKHFANENKTDPRVVVHTPTLS